MITYIEVCEDSKQFRKQNMTNTKIMMRTTYWGISEMEFVTSGWIR